MPPLRLPPRKLLPLLLLIPLAAGWGLVWRAADRSIVTRVPILDEAYYLRQGAAIAGGEWAPRQPFVMSPLYPYLVAATGSGRTTDPRGARLGSPPYGLRVAQALAWLGIVMLLYRAARRLLPGPRWLAWIPPLLFAGYGPAAVLVSTALLEIPLTLAVLAALSLLPLPSDGGEGGSSPPARGASPVRELAGAGAARRGGPAPSGTGARHARQWPRARAFGALVGCATLLRPTAVLLLGPAWLAWRAQRGAGEAWRPLAVATLAALAVLAPAVVHNSVAAGRLVGVSANGGLNFHIGEGPGANGFFRTYAGLDFDTDPAGVAFLSARLKRPLAGPAEADSVWFAEALASVRAHPWRSLGLWLKKLWLHFAAWEIDQVTPLSAWRRDVPPLRALAIPYGAISALGLVGLALAGARRPWQPWSAALLLLVAAQSLFFVVSRYRLALVPVLCLLAGAAVAEVWRRRGRARLAEIGLAALAGLAVVPWGLGEVRTTWRAAGLSNEASRWAHLGGAADLARAESLLREAVAVDPKQVQAWQQLARVLQVGGRTAEAERALADGALRADLPYLLDKDLITLTMEQQRYADALPRLDRYLRERPDDGDMLHAMAIALAESGRVGAALETAARLMAVAPDDPRGYIDRGVLLARSGRGDEARAVFERGVQRFPDNASLRHNLALAEAAARRAAVPAGDENARRMSSPPALR